MPRAIRLLDDDIDITGGRFSLIEGPDQVAQRVEGELKVALGEWFLDRNRGFPYLQEVFIQAPVLASIEGTFSSFISAIPGVESVENVNIRTDELAAGRLVINLVIRAVRERVSTRTTISLPDFVIAA